MQDLTEVIFEMLKNICSFINCHILFYKKQEKNIVKHFIITFD